MRAVSPVYQVALERWIFQIYFHKGLLAADLKVDVCRANSQSPPDDSGFHSQHVGQ